MKLLFRYLALLLAFCWLAGCIKSDSEPTEKQLQPEKRTTIYIVRHAEKGTNDPDNPDLTNVGKARAEALKTLLQNKNITAIYSTDYKRCKQTAEPLAKAKNLQIQLYKAHDYGAITGKILKENRNQTVLVIGHSNSVLELIEAFKAPRPVPELTDSDYDYLFKVTVPEAGNAKAEVQYYGK